MELDCRGMRCPIPIIKLAQAIKVHPEVILMSDDPATEPDLVAWSRMTGHPFKKLSESLYLIQKK